MTSDTNERKPPSSIVSKRTVDAIDPKPQKRRDPLEGYRDRVLTRSEQEQAYVRMLERKYCV